jgi:ABC-type Zn uptake system ZnuABC Zn-binding protein ZnuA
MKKMITAVVLIAAAVLAAQNARAADRIKVVTTFSDFASITQQITGDLAVVEHLSHGDQDPHFVPPKPSLALKLKDADMLVSTGFDLELWLATLQDKARNREIMDGAKGFVTVSPGIEVLQKPETFSRSEGDVHIMGNPHFHTSPLNWRQISENILIGLRRVDPSNADIYEANQKAFVDRMYRSMFGDDLVDMFGGERLEDMLRAGTLFEFLDNEYEGEKLVTRLGGWVARAMPFRGMEVVAYHKNWAYFVRDFGLTVLGYIEPKPGIPPTPRHVEQTIQLIGDRGIDMMLVATYFERRKPMTISSKTGIEAIFLPLSVGAVPEATDVFALVDYWIDSINAAVGNSDGSDSEM